MHQIQKQTQRKTVALRKESVDRNLAYHYSFKLFKRSLSARRAWIEIFINREISLMRPVALRKESVDRNLSVSGVNDPGR